MDLDLGSKRAKKLIRDHDLTEEEIPPDRRIGADQFGDVRS